MIKIEQIMSRETLSRIADRLKKLGEYCYRSKEGYVEIYFETGPDRIWIKWIETFSDSQPSGRIGISPSCMIKPGDLSNLDVVGHALESSFTLTYRGGGLGMFKEKSESDGSEKYEGRLLSDNDIDSVRKAIATVIHSKKDRVEIKHITKIKHPKFFGSECVKINFEKNSQLGCVETEPFSGWSEFGLLEVNKEYTPEGLLGPEVFKVEYKEPSLTEEEKEILTHAIIMLKKFPDVEIKSVEKFNAKYLENGEYVQINFRCWSSEYMYVRLPEFPQNTLFKSLGYDLKYTLEELQLED